ncbi:hypothetical protein [Streptomyces kanamyceticus]|uniref:hypothetical protein n=1 Tax=Streptomyces kanamyceticus TaxID=1967 RepID=UPI0037DDD815
MKSAVSRVVVAVSVVAALGATAACGGSGDGGKKPAKPGAGSAKGGAATRLEKAALVAGDVKGYKVEKPEAREASSGSAGAEPSKAPKAPEEAGKTDPAVCAPFAALLGPDTGPGAANSPKAKAHVGRILTGADGKDLTTTDVRLSAYAEADAERVMAGLRAASKSKKCATFRVGGHRYFGVRPLSAPDKSQTPDEKGDEAVSYKLAHPKGEYVTRQTVTVVRDGGTLAVFDASNLYDPAGVQDDKEAERNGMEGIGTPKADEDPKVAAAIVDAQLRKL